MAFHRSRSFKMTRRVEDLRVGEAGHPNPLRWIDSAVSAFAATSSAATSQLVVVESKNADGTTLILLEVRRGGRPPAGRRWLQLDEMFDRLQGEMLELWNRLNSAGMVPGCAEDGRGNLTIEAAPRLS
jgi:hypothetical protein